MNVTKRPPEIENMIRNFRNYIAHKDEKMANEGLEKLRMVLSEEDPFFVTAKVSLARLRR